MNTQTNMLEVWLDCDLASPCLVGSLGHDRGQIRFHYNRDWLHHPSAFALDPDLSMDEAPFFPKPELGNFGIFLDSSPYRWGQTLMKRREVLLAKDEQRNVRRLYGWDFFMGVQDLTRQGGLRVCIPGTQDFLSHDALSAPPMSTLRELEAVAFQLSHRQIDDLDALRKWLSVLVAPGASLGGARPKANFTEEDGSLWIAKFPARDDDRDMGAWEYITHQMAKQAGIDVPEAQLIRLNNDFHTFCTKRFDRADGKRRFYASAMTLLRKNQSEGSSYLDLAHFLRTQSDGIHSASDLTQLFRRVVFNVSVGNRDDHLRNHGFVLTATGWRLAPAFDVNPSPDKSDHVLNIDASDNRPVLATVLATAGFYGLTPSLAKQIMDEVLEVTSRWREFTRQTGIAKAEVELTAPAFN